tara:strand:- start:882 stop:1553 length:672 start_codon:yes stop_codon:yes gene_type:complete
MAICYVSETKNGQLAYSEDKEQSEWKHKWKKQTVFYSLQKDSVDIIGRAKELRAVNLAMSTWNFEIPLKLKSVRGTDQTPDIYINFVKSENDELLKKGTLAYAYYPKTSHAGKIVFNEDYMWSLDGKPVNAHDALPELYPKPTTTTIYTYNMVHVLIHEIGHSLGLTHDANNPASVMWWQYNGQLHLNKFDVKRITDKYGKRKWNPRIYLRIKRWLSRRKNRI